MCWCERIPRLFHGEVPLDCVDDDADKETTDVSSITDTATDSVTPDLIDVDYVDAAEVVGDASSQTGIMMLPVACRS